VATNVTDITNFADVYLGAAASDPATRNDGSALQAGDLYFNTTDDRLTVYTGTDWEATITDSATIRSLFSAGGDLSYNSSTGEFSFTERTDSEVRGLFSAAGDLSYTAATGEFSVTTYKDSDVDAHLTGGTGVTYNAGDISIGQDVGTGQSVTFLDAQFTGTTAVTLPDGTQAQRPASPQTGMLRFNTDLTSFEGYDGSAWGEIGGGGGATGGGDDQVFYENNQTVTADYTITSDKNAMSTGPVAVASGVTVTVETGARYVVI